MYYSYMLNIIPTDDCVVTHIGDNSRIVTAQILPKVHRCYIHSAVQVEMNRKMAITFNYVTNELELQYDIIYKYQICMNHQDTILQEVNIEEN